MSTDAVTILLAEPAQPGDLLFLRVEQRALIRPGEGWDLMARYRHEQLWSLVATTGHTPSAVVAEGLRGEAWLDVLRDGELVQLARWHPAPGWLRRQRQRLVAVLVYLGAITAANVAAATLGPWVTPITAFLLIGLDLTLRDRLHDAWTGNWLAPRMGALILAGGVLSYLATPAAGQIALASAVAWGAASAADALVYAVLRHLPRWQRVNGSNLVGAAVDSLLFPTLAFGALLPLIVAGQFLAKVAGGAAWYVVIRAVSQRRPAA